MRGIETAQAVTGVMRVLGHLADAFVALAEWVGNVRRAPRAPVRANGDIGIATPTVPKPPIKPQPGQKTPATATEPAKTVEEQGLTEVAAAAAARLQARTVPLHPAYEGVYDAPAEVQAAAPLFHEKYPTYEHLPPEAFAEGSPERAAAERRAKEREAALPRDQREFATMGDFVKL